MIALYAYIDDIGCVVHFQGKTYYGRTGEDNWIDHNGQATSFPQFDAIINTSNYWSRPATKDELEKWAELWDEDLSQVG